MNLKYSIANGILWAAAIVAAALLQAPTVLTLLILPALGVCALTALEGRAERSICKSGRTQTLDSLG